MALRRSTLRTIGSLAIALVLVATATAGAVAAPRGSAGSKTGGATPVAAPGKRLTNDIKLTTRQAGTRAPVNVRRVAAKKPTVRDYRTLPFLSREASAGPAPSSGGPKVVAPAPAPPVEATLNGQPTARKGGFDGLAQNTSSATSGEPPDPWVAVGPEHIVQAVNLSLRITDREGNSPTDITLPDFFQLPPPSVVPTFDSDPHVIYDSLHGRWLATEVSWDCDASDPSVNFGHGYIDFAVSRTIDPRGTWDVGYIYFPDQLPDFPAPGTSTDKIAFASNVFDMVAGADCVTGTSPFVGGDVIYMDWADVLDLGSLTVLESFFPESGLVNPNVHFFTPRVAVQVPATSGRLHIVMQYDFGTGTVGLGYASIVGSVKGGTLDLERIDNLTDEYPLVSGFVDPLPPRQPGSPGTIVDAVDSRPTDAIWQGNRLVLVSTQACTPAGDSAPRDCVRVTELNTATVGPGASATATLTQDFLVTEVGKDVFMGGVGLSGDGTLHVAYTRSSATATDYAVARIRHQALGDPLNSVSQEENEAGGSANYPGTRWGDYVGVAQDPQ
ncbi:MAG: hypothetical protein QOF11_1492, partial [Chloroflexota bacterium]|nr:hypothetical protein [Chloroflexota bacterium]